jgi:penicillin-binding protein 1C
MTNDLEDTFLDPSKKGEPDAEKPSETRSERPSEEITSDSPSEMGDMDEAAWRFRRLILAREHEALDQSQADLVPSITEPGSEQPDPDVPSTPPFGSTDPPKYDPEGATLPPPPMDEPDSPDLDQDILDSPLPRRVPERDPASTQVGTSAYVPPPSTAPVNGTNNGSSFWLGCRGCFIRLVVLSLFVIIALVIGVVSFGLYQYSSLAATLPSVENLQANAAQFETTRILDREGNLLYEILDPNAGRRSYVPLDEISPYMVAAVVATEDSQFYSNPGYDLLAIARAFLQNYQEGEVVSGASTITQQIARILLFTPEERYQISARRKTREIMLAAQVNRNYTKEEILELYLNQVYFGNLAYGVEAAAESYFGTTADKLTLAQASFLTGLIQAPSVYDIFSNREATLGRQQQVLVLMVEASEEQGCIYVSNSPQAICVSPEDAGRAAAELTNYEFTPAYVQMRFPHWVNYIRSELERMYDPQTIYRSGFTVYTTLDPGLQRQAEDILYDQVTALADRRVSDGALVAIRPNNGEILAMVGSADFYNEEIDGQINMAVRPRQPGSSIKPLTYAAAFEKGWTAGTLIWDVESEFPPSGNPDDPRPPYEPVNYDERFHGPVTARAALANSYNVPAVKTLDYVRIYDDPTTPQEDGLIAFSKRMGITTLTRDDYGLSLTLGGGDVTLLELTGAYATFANGGVRVPPVGILRIIDFRGETVYAFEAPRGEQVIRAEHAYLITSILSDNVARTPAFGPNSALNLPFRVAAKTGTTNDFRDNWTLGYTPDIAIGVWVGNADYTPMENTSGLTGAAPIWNQFMQIAVQDLTGSQPTPFLPPVGIMERVVCTVSGAEPSEWCPSHSTEIFASDQPPLPKEQDLWRKVWVDSYSLELASAACPEYAIDKLGLSVNDPWGREWLQETSAGKKWAKSMGFEEDELFFIPEESCTADSPRPILALTDPSEGASINTSPLAIFGKAAGTANFKRWELHYGSGYDPDSWKKIASDQTPHEQPDKLVDWELEELPNGPVTLRLTVFSTTGGKADVRLHLSINLPTPTPTATPTSTPSPTPTPSSTSSPTPTVVPTSIPTNTPSPTVSPSPTANATATATSTPAITPTTP